MTEQHRTADDSLVDPTSPRATSQDAVWREWIAAITRPGIGAVVVLTIVGAVLRFVNLDQPALLFDEAATYTRVTGSFRELLNILRFDGFAPLHYELYWLMARFVRLTPAIMRLVPAVAGTAMIPAVYFLARQMTSKRVATVAAAIASFSAFLNVYSRDAKMYMSLWLFATLFIAGLLWWAREPNARLRRVALLTWVASGCAMNGLHALGLLVVAVAIVIVLTHPRRDSAMLTVAAAGFVITCLGIAGHYALFNQFGQKVRDEGWRASGLDWVGQRNERLGKPMVLWDTAATWLLAYRAPRPPITPPTRVITPVAIVSGILLALLAAGAWHWPGALRDDDPDDAPLSARKWRGPVWLSAWIVLPCTAFAVVQLVKGRDVWTARYLGIVWPAVAVGSAWLIQRLPVPWLRAGAITLFVGANLVQVVLKMTVDTAAPIDAIARDVAAAKKSDGTTYAVVAVNDDPTATSLGGNGGIYDFPGRYYLTVEQRLHLRPKQLRGGAMPKALSFPTDVSTVPPAAGRVVVWTDVKGETKNADPILTALGTGWVRQSFRDHTVRDFWNWRGMFRCRRSVYVRGEATAGDAAAESRPAPRAKKRK